MEREEEGRAGKKRRREEKRKGKERKTGEKEKKKQRGGAQPAEQVKGTHKIFFFFAEATEKIFARLPLDMLGGLCSEIGELYKKYNSKNTTKPCPTKRLENLVGKKQTGGKNNDRHFQLQE